MCVEIITRKLDVKTGLAILFVFAFVSLTNGLSSTLFVKHSILLTFTNSLPVLLSGVACLLLVIAPFLRWSKTEIALLLASICFLGEQYFAIHSNGINEKGYQYPSLLAIGMLSSIVARRFAREIDLQRSRKFLATVINFGLGFFFIEACVRAVYSPYVHTVLRQDMDGYNKLYKFKFSVFFMEANYVSMALLCILAIMQSHPRFFRRKHFFLAYLLLGFTFSRAVLLPAIAQMMFSKWWSRRRVLLLAVAAGVVTVNIAIFFLAIQRPEFFADPSFTMRMLSLAAAFNFLRDGQLSQIILGIGFGNSTYALGMPIHSIAGTFVLEFGVLGTVLFISFICLMTLGSSRAMFFLLIPFLIYGISIVGIVTSYFLFTLGLLSGCDAHSARYQLQHEESSAQGLKEGLRSA